MNRPLEGGRKTPVPPARAPPLLFCRGGRRKGPPPDKHVVDIYCWKTSFPASSLFPGIHFGMGSFKTCKTKPLMHGMLLPQYSAFPSLCFPHQHPQWEAGEERHLSENFQKHGTLGASLGTHMHGWREQAGHSLPDSIELSRGGGAGHGRPLGSEGGEGETGHLFLGGQASLGHLCLLNLLPVLIFLSSLLSISLYIWLFPLAFGK